MPPRIARRGQAASSSAAFVYTLQFTLVITMVALAISGEHDPIALPEYAEAYVARAKPRGVAASLMTLPDKGHEILLDDAVVEVTARAVRALGGATP